MALQRNKTEHPKDVSGALGVEGRRFIAEALGPVGGFCGPLARNILEHVHDIRFTDEAETARVRLQGGRFLLEISPAFAKEFLPAPEDKRFVLMHEISHLERGDLLRQGRYFRRYPRTVNFAMDMYVNGSVLGSGYFPKGEPRVFDRSYDPRRVPCCLLLPPWRLLDAWTKEVPEAEWHRKAARWVVGHRRIHWSRERGSPPRHALTRLMDVLGQVFSAAGFGNPQEACRLYLGAWTGTMPFGDHIERLVRLLGSEGLLEDVEGTPLLFEHDLEALGELHRTGDPRPGRGSQLGSDSSRQPDPPPSAERRQFYHMLRAALVSDPSHPSLSRDADVIFPSVLLHLGRREVALLAAGALPILCNAPSRALALTDERVHLYIDVSGSMEDLLSFATGLVQSAGELLGPQVYQFSNRVLPLTWDDLAAGNIVSTGGTDLDCVARHASRKLYRRILVVTDGWVALDKDSTRILCREVETFVVVLSDSGTLSDGHRSLLDSFARKVWIMPGR